VLKILNFSNKGAKDFEVRQKEEEKLECSE
jgi:hypothetical protein